MTLSGRSRSRMPPRFVARTMIATFAMVGFVLAAVFVILSLAVRGTVRSTVADRLDAGQRILSALEQRRSYQMQAQVATLAENPTLKAAMDTYHAEMWLDHGADSRQHRARTRKACRSDTARHPRGDGSIRLDRGTRRS
jgi:hypothetical protein